MLTHAIVDLSDVMERANNLVNNIKYGENISAIILIEYILSMGHTDNFTYDFWDYIESVLTEEQIERIDVKLISEIIEVMFSDIFVEISKTLGISDPGVFTFIRWLNKEAAFLEINTIPKEARWLTTKRRYQSI